MITEDVIVYADPDGLHYVANFTEHGWLRWPAVAGGWLSRRGCAATRVDDCEELDTLHGGLALKLSGVEASS